MTLKIIDNQYDRLFYRQLGFLQVENETNVWRYDTVLPVEPLSAVCDDIMYCKICN